MDFDPLLLSRVQFAFTIAFHIVFPSLSIGLAAMLVLIEGLWLRSNDAVWRRLYEHWAKIFAIVFVFGVLSGISLSFQLGTNWGRFSEATANVLGPLFGFEVFTAFFYQATFLGIMLFGWRLVGPSLHFLATCAVAIGTLASTFWVVAANSWMHSPAGYELRDGVFFATDWMAVVFNPTFPYRFVHTILGAYVATAFAVAGIASWLLLRRRKTKDAGALLKLVLVCAAILVPLQLIAGHEHGLSTYRMQPVKHAAIGGHWQSHDGKAPLVLLAMPDQDAQTNRNEIAIPEIGSLLATGSLDGEITGLSTYPRTEQPNVAIVFWSFRIMAGIGAVLLIAALLGGWAAWRWNIARLRTLQVLFVVLMPSGIVAVLAGWVTAEVGRQPYTVHGLLRTSESLSPITGTEVATSLALFAVSYLVVFTAGTVALLRFAATGPAGGEDLPMPVEPEPAPEPEPEPAPPAEPEHRPEPMRTQSAERTSDDDGDLELPAALRRTDDQPVGRSGDTEEVAQAEDDPPPRRMMKFRPFGAARRKRDEQKGDDDGDA